MVYILQMTISIGIFWDMGIYCNHNDLLCKYFLWDVTDVASHDCDDISMVKNDHPRD